MDRGARQATVHGVAESDPTEQLGMDVTTYIGTYINKNVDMKDRCKGKSLLSVVYEMWYSEQIPVKVV